MKTLSALPGQAVKLLAALILSVSSAGAADAAFVCRPHGDDMRCIDDAGNTWICRPNGDDIRCSIDDD